MARESSGKYSGFDVLLFSTLPRTSRDILICFQHSKKL